jgi:hypothetical protein
VALVIFPCVLHDVITDCWMSKCNGTTFVQNFVKIGQLVQQGKGSQTHLTVAIEFNGGGGPNRLTRLDTALWILIQGVVGSNLCRDTGYRDMFLWFSSVPSCKRGDTSASVSKLYRMSQEETVRNRHMCILTFLLRLTDTVTSQNTDLPPGTPCIASNYWLNWKGSGRGLLEV